MKLSEEERIRQEMDRILREQADPNRPSPLVERWGYLDRRKPGRAALREDGE